MIIITIDEVVNSTFSAHIQLKRFFVGHRRHGVISLNLCHKRDEISLAPPVFALFEITFILALPYFHSRFFISHIASDVFHLSAKFKNSFCLPCATHYAPLCSSSDFQAPNQIDKLLEQIVYFTHKTHKFLLFDSPYSILTFTIT